MASLKIALQKACHNTKVPSHCLGRFALEVYDSFKKVGLTN